MAALICCFFILCCCAAACFVCLCSSLLPSENNSACKINLNFNHVYFHSPLEIYWCPSISPNTTPGPSLSILMSCSKADSYNWNFMVDNNNECSSRMTENRKRSRDDEGCEFMPLSKRINNLHLNNNQGSSSQENIQLNGISQNSQMNGVVQSSQNGIMQYSSNQSSSSSSNLSNRPEYDPGMNSSQSHYYFDNKLLFELHLERIERSGQQF